MERVVAVTGSASGIGAAVTRRFRTNGGRVIEVDLHDAEVVADLSTAPGRLHAVSEVNRLAEGRLHGLVACAGLGPHTRPLGRVVAVNYFGVVEVLDGLLPALARVGDASAVAISSNSAGLVPPRAELLDALLAGDEEEGAVAAADATDGPTVYGTTKLALSRAVRRRAGPWGEAGVRLNAVAPGPVDTPLLQGSLDDVTLGPLVDALPVPLGRRAGPDEIALAIGFLLHPANGYVHGSVLFVDGGTDALLRPDAI